MNVFRPIYFMMASWALCIVSWILVACAYTVLDVPTDAVSTAMVAVALILPLGVFLITKDMGDETKVWTFHTIASMVMLAVIAVAMSLWVGSVYDLSVKADFLKVADYALYFAVIWLVYGIVNTAFFIMSVFSVAPASGAPKGGFAEDLAGILADIDAYYGSNSDFGAGGRR